MVCPTQVIAGITIEMLIMCEDNNQFYFLRDETKPDDESLINIPEILSNISEENTNQVLITF